SGACRRRPTSDQRLLHAEIVHDEPSADIRDDVGRDPEPQTFVGAHRGIPLVDREPQQGQVAATGESLYELHTRPPGSRAARALVHVELADEQGLLRRLDPHGEVADRLLTALQQEVLVAFVDLSTDGGGALKAAQHIVHLRAADERRIELPPDLACKAGGCLDLRVGGDRNEMDGGAHPAKATRKERTADGSEKLRRFLYTSRLAA